MVQPPFPFKPAARSGHVLTVVVAVYNGEATIGKALDSIRAQKDARIELVVIDGNSSDRTRLIVEAAGDLVDQFVSEPDTGIYNAWNKGLALARGEWISFLGADDVFTEGALAAYLAAAADADDAVDLISSRVRYHPNFGEPFVIGREWKWHEFRRHMTIAHVGALHRRGLYARLGAYDERYRICGDYELLLRARDTLEPLFIPALTVEMGGDGVSNNQLLRTFAETCRAKWESGGRSRVMCEAERHWDYFRAKVKRALHHTLRKLK